MFLALVFTVWYFIARLFVLLQKCYSYFKCSSACMRTGWDIGWPKTMVKSSELIRAYAIFIFRRAREQLFERMVLILGGSMLLISLTDGLSKGLLRCRLRWRRKVRWANRRRELYGVEWWGNVLYWGYWDSDVTPFKHLTVDHIML